MAPRRAEKSGKTVATKLGIKMLVEGEGLRQRVWQKAQTPGNQFALRFFWPRDNYSRCRIETVDSTDKCYHTLHIPSPNHSYHIYMYESDCSVKIHEYSKDDGEVSSACFQS